MSISLIFLAGAMVFLVHTQPVSAADNPAAGDTAGDPAYASGFNDQTNGGHGFLPWHITATGSAGAFIANGSPVGDGSKEQAFDLFANPDGNATAKRAFQTPLSPGSAFSLTFKNSSIDPGKTVGVQFCHGATPVFTFFYVGNVAGGTYGYNVGDIPKFTHDANNYYYAASGDSTGVTYTSGAQTLTLTVVGLHHYKIIQSAGGSPSKAIMFTSDDGVDGIGVFDNSGGAGSDLQFDDLTISRK